MKLANGNVLHVIEIAKSARRPHAVGRVDNGWFFPKRTNKGNEGMSFDEIRDAFAANAAVDQHLDALDGELRVNIQVWQEQRNRLPNPTLNATMSRALEDFLRTPFLKNVISVSDVSILWQQTKAISALASWLMQPLQTQEVVEAGLKEIAKELDGAIARCVKVREQIASARDLLG
ncbi:MAG: hypothetical protein JNL83_37440 [Myxococcales bacterium]|nr:hypothetical protein [Myxococcales bacterium]